MAASRRRAGFRELRPAELRWVCDPGRYDLSVPRSKLSGLGIIGQERAIRAMKMGIELYSPGYNVFVCGITGTGRTSTVKRILDNIKSSCPLPLDRCYVHNFRQPDRPRLIALPRGHAAKFQRDMERFAHHLPTVVRHALDAPALVRKRQELTRRVDRAGDRLLADLKRRAARAGFALRGPATAEPGPPDLLPMVAGKAVPLAQIETMVEQKQLSAGRARTITGRHARLHQELEAVAREGRKMLEGLEAKVAALERARILEILREPVRRIAARHAEPRIDEYLDDAVRHVAERLDLLRVPQPAEAAGGSQAPGSELEALLGLLQVNVVLDNTRREGCPVVVEAQPTYRRLFGCYEKALDRTGNWTTDYRRIRAGSILAADGGYLVLSAEDLFTQGGLWQRLKRALVTRALEIVDEGTPLQAPVSSMAPEPIPINTKVILIGDAATYQTLYAREPDFRKIFKVLADFDDTMERTPNNLRQCAAFVARMCAEENLATFEPRAVGALAEYGARMAGSQRKLTARFGEMSDVIREADYWRRGAGSRRVSATHVKTAIEEMARRGGMWEDKFRDLIARDLLRIEVTGRRVGELNGLAVHQAGAHAFGLPARISAAAAPGDAGLINIEREARLSGRTHDKGVLIIGGFLRLRFGHDKPIALAASLAFEQSYAEVEGDSASSAEMYALLSALSGLPIDQGIAVTGSVDQKGMIQAVGGVDEKVEGYLRVCRMKGLTRRQGVVLPEANVPDLMLEEEVVDAVRKGRFHLWPVRTVDEGIAILTGRPAGARGRDGRYPPGSVMALVDRRLTEFKEIVGRLRAGRG